MLKPTKLSPLVNLSTELTDLISRLDTGLSQHARLSTLTHTHTETRPDNFVVERIQALNAMRT